MTDNRPEPNDEEPQQPGAAENDLPPAEHSALSKASELLGGNKKSGIAIGLTAALAVLGLGTFFVIARSDGISDDGAHKLSMPATTVNGQYQKVDAKSDPVTEEERKRVESWGVHDFSYSSALYKTGKGVSEVDVTVWGFSGTIDDPEKSVDALFGYIASGETVLGKNVGEFREFKPSGFENGIMKCQQTEKDGVVVKKYAFCIWGDHSTLAYVAAYDPVDLGSVSWSSMTPAEAAELTAQIRHDVRVRI